MARNEGLHLFRGLCAIGVVIYHYLSWEYGIAIESAGAFLVYVFFIISAITMMMVHGPDFQEQVDLVPLLSFYWRRIARILPLLGSATIAAMLFAGIGSSAWSVDLFARGLLTGTALFGLQMPGLISNVVAAWSLGIEATFYLVFPLLALIVAHVRFRSLVIATALLILSQQAAIHVISGYEGAQFWFNYANPLVFTPFFMIGVIIFLRPLPESKFHLLLALLSLAGIFGFSFAVPVDVYRSPLVYLILTALAAAATWTSYSSQISSRLVSRIGGYLGNISYSLYLTHWFAFRISGRVEDLAGVPKWLLFVVGAPRLAYASYRLVEMPARNGLRLWLDNRFIKRQPSSLRSSRPLRATFLRKADRCLS